MDGDHDVWQPFAVASFMARPGSPLRAKSALHPAGAPFWLNSVDFYSSTTQIPYVIEGFLSGEPAYTVVTVLPNTFGRFVRTENPSDHVAVDELVIRLSNPAAPCCGNPMGIDNIVLSR